MRNPFARLAAFCLGAALCAATSASAQIFSPLHIFSTASVISAPLTQGPDGTFYGVSSGGGLDGYGTVFKLQPDGTRFTILYSFTNGTDGAGPAAGLVLSGNTLYGTAPNAGGGGHGTVFQINTDGSGFAPVYSFTAYNGSGTNSDGATPEAALVLAGSALYGTTSAGGSHNSAGTIFKVNTDGTGFTNLYTFNGPLGGFGAFPVGGLVLSGSTLYGTAEEGGSNFNGMVFGIITNGMGFTNLYSFSAKTSGTNGDGALPVATLILTNGTLYGTAMQGGRGGYGTVFRLNTDGSAFTNLYNFTNGVEGGTLEGSLVLAGNALYGTANGGGNFPGYGTVFRLNTDGSGFTNLHRFGGTTGDGKMPTAGFVLAGSALYGTTQQGGNGVNGTVFRINTDGSGYAMIANGSDGANPEGGLALSGGACYGTTSAGGAFGGGTLFQVNTDGTGFTTIYAFHPAVYDSAAGGYTNADASTPRGTLALSGNTLYGAANSGGSIGYGTIFSVNTDGSGFTNLYSFTNGVDGANPVAGVVLAGGALFGMTPGDAVSFGSIFEVGANGSGFNVLHSFSPTVAGTNSDGTTPQSGLTLAGDTLYGTAYYGGLNSAGTLFEINTNGFGFTTLYNFKAPTSPTDTTNVNGANPVGSLILSGETLYGTASHGGAANNGRSPTIGTVFKINTDGSNFMRLTDFGNAFNGIYPMAGLALSGGTLYGTTSEGGNGSAGTVFELDTNGNNFATIHAFAFEGGTPLGDLVVAGNQVYGTSEFSSPGSGFVFVVTPTGAPMIQFTANPTNAIPPAAVQFHTPVADDYGNPIIQWQWFFGDGSTTTAQSPTHTYTNAGGYTPTLLATNNNYAQVTGFGPAIVLAYPNSILNGGFETGTFTNWTRSGNYSGSSISTASAYRHAGTYGAQLNASGTLGYLSQTISTTAGAIYLVSLWLDSPNGIKPNEFSVTWNGSILFDETNLTAIGWTNLEFLVPATTNNTTLQLGWRNDSAYFGLDQVSVVPAQPGIASITLAGTNLVLNSTGGLSNRTYYVLMGTNAEEPLSEWTPLTTNVLGADGNFIITATNGVNPGDPRQFFILQIH